MELVLNTYGVSLNREGECFVIKTADGKQRLPTMGISSIQISRGAQITSDAVMRDNCHTQLSIGRIAL